MKELEKYQGGFPEDLRVKAEPPTPFGSVMERTWQDVYPKYYLCSECGFVAGFIEESDR